MPQTKRKQSSPKKTDVRKNNKMGVKRVKTTGSNAFKKPYIKGHKTTAVVPRNYMTWRNPRKERKGSGTDPVFHFYIILTSLYDPFVTGAATNQAVGYDSYTPTLYERYKVFSGYFSALMQMEGVAQGDFWLVYYISRSNVAPVTMRQALGQLGAKKAIVNSDATSSEKATRIYVPFRTSDFIPYDDFAWTLYSANPTYALYLNFVIARTGSASMSEDVFVQYLGELVQQAEMGERTSNVLPES